MLGRQVQQQLHQFLEAGGEAAGHLLQRELGALLNRADGGCGHALEGVCVQASGLAADPSALLLHLIEQPKHRHRLLADERLSKRLNHAGGIHADDAAVLVVQHVLHVDLAVHNPNSRVDALGERVQHSPRQLSVNLLEIHRAIREIVADERVRVRVNVEISERDAVPGLVGDDFVAIAHQAHAPKLCDAVAVHIFVRVALNVEHPLGIQVRIGQLEAVSGESLAVPRQIIVFRLVTLYEILRIAHCDQIGDGFHAPMSRELRIFQGTGVSGDQELLWRQIFDANLFPGLHAPDFAVECAVFCLLYLQKLNITVVEQFVERDQRQSGKTMITNRHRAIIERLDYANLLV